MSTVSTVLDHAVFLRSMRRLAGGVVLVTACSPEGEAIGLTATAVCSLTVEPPSLLVCVNRSSTLGRILTPGLAFCVNLLAPHHEVLAQVFGGMRQVPREARFGYGQWDASPSGVPLLRDAEASFTCQVGNMVSVGTHIIVIGECLDVALPLTSCGALAYRDGAFHAIAP